MSKRNKHSQFIKLRTEYPFFSYDSYEIKQINDQLHIRFCFNLSDKYYFYPKMIFPSKPPISPSGFNIIKNLVFHIGMIEVISYWKAACSPKLLIKTHSLSREQINWWKKLYFNGLGEFFYLNAIHTDESSFMQIEANEGSELKTFNTKLEDNILVPVGGGKDSVVSLEFLKQSGKKIIPYQVNQNPSRNKSIENAGFVLEESIEVKRNIHPKLLELNEKGFLNGHTPFSALLAFSSLLAAFLNNSKHIALSNESSASESTVPDTKINHQYSKSVEFETDFREYVAEFISPDFNYFSFLRPLNELQIAKLFSKFEHHFKDFRSCNVGSKNNSWCGRCPKCLFTYIILSPFLEEENLQQIFGKNLLEDESLKSTLDELSGQAAVKPFECVGTIDDVNIALQLKLKKHAHQKLPALLDYYKNKMANPTIPAEKIKQHLTNLEAKHFVPDELLKLIKARLKDE